MATELMDNESNTSRHLSSKMNVYYVQQTVLGVLRDMEVE